MTDHPPEQPPREPPDPSKRVLRCPACRKPRVQRYRPFCSARCRDLDLSRWFGEAYTVPVVEPGYDEDDDGA